MNIIHAVTLVSDDGAFGGPLRVALNQVQELMRRGHDVRLVAGWRGAGKAPVAVDGVPVSLFPVRQLLPGGFSGLISPGMLQHLRRLAPGADVMHIHTGRDLIGLGAAQIARSTKVPFVTQTHGMIGVDARLKARVLDAVAVRRLVGAAHRHLVLTDREAIDLPLVLRTGRLERVANGVSMPPEVPRQSRRSREVLYCARLHPRKRPVAFVEMAAAVVERVPEATFAMVGPDEGELGAVEAAIDRLGLRGTVTYEGALPYEDTLSRMSKAAVYVLPSVHEPFPMSLLEAMSTGLPSVCTDSCGISSALASRRAALVTDGSVEAMADAVSTLLADGQNCAEQGRRGRVAVHENYSISAVVDQLERLYGEVTRSPRSV